MKLPRFARLLPGVVLVSATLLVLNGTGLMRGAAALAQTALDAAPQPANPDYAGSDDQIASANQADILTSLSKRRAELDAREGQLRLQANIMTATESRVDAKIAQLQALQTKISSLLTQRDDEQKAQITALVKTYSAMGKKAGPIFAGLPDDVAVPVARGMSPDILSQILGAMPADAAQKLTVKLANRLALPETADAPAPAPVQTASNAPAPGAPTAPAPAADPKK